MICWELKLCKKWFLKLYELTKDDGRFCLNIPLDKSKGGYQSVGSDLTVLANSVKDVMSSTKLILFVGVGVGIFLVLGILKIMFKSEM